MIVRGPFRGARMLLNPRDSLRKVFGLYEYELNHWIEKALECVDTVIDVGANDGYFSFGCAAAFRRLKKAGRILAFEPQDKAYAQLLTSKQCDQKIDIQIEKRFVGSHVAAEFVTLDAIAAAAQSLQTERTLIKIDVEGAEEDVIAGATSWMKPTNLFLIEIHSRTALDRINARFADKGIQLQHIDQRPLLILGREQRSGENSWLVSRLT